MSIQSAMQAGVMGLFSQSARMSSISDNIANSGTVGYKRASVDFSTLVTPSAGGSYAAGGVSANARLQISKQGIINPGSSTTDLAISGRGFFLVTNSVTGGATAKTALTRAGSFLPDENGNLRNTAGYYLLGWPAKADGTIGPVDQDGTGSLQVVNVNTMTAAGQPTTTMGFSGNLPADQTGPDAPTVPFKTSAEFFSPLGASDRLFLEWQPSTTRNQWTLTVADASGNKFGSVDVTFNDSGPNAGQPASWSNATAGGFGGFSFDTATGQAVLSVPNGSTPQQVTLSLGAPNTAGGVVQFAGTYNPKISKDGAAVGRLSRVEADESGKLIGIFDNGARRTLYQIPIADVANPDGLNPEDGNVYTISRESGAMRLWGAGTGPVGSVAGGSLESSNVDLAEELTQLIQTQRAYSSNAKIVQTADEMLNETTQLKR
ncbi:flagellar hook protein FlgE [Inquilinus sp. NPDC058860]|uniref:flagellar hook protein FlgE n=1 Tax=Inquilinus sp. NPDC058860 TaxID=3346652 RepID=UPI0036A5E823